MSTPANFDPNQRPTADDDRLRAAFDFLSAPPGELSPPPAHLWAGVEAGIRPVRATGWNRWRPALTGVLGVVVGVLLMLGWKGVQHQERSVGADRHTGEPSQSAIYLSDNGGHPAQPDGSRGSNGGTPAQPDAFRDANGTLPAQPDASRYDNGAPSAEPNGLPAVSATISAVPLPSVPVVPAVLLPLTEAETTYAALPAADSAAAEGAATRAARRRALLQERTALAALTRRADSLLLALGVGAEVVALASDSLLPAPTLSPSKWSVALAFAPERNFFGLNAPAEDTLSALRRTHETGRAGFSAALLAEYRLDKRLSVGAGLGLTSYGAELRLTDRQTHISTRLDSSIVRSATVVTVIRDAYSVRTVPDSVLAPILNANQQVIGYQYLPTTRLDTVWTRIENTRVDSLTRKTYTPTITTRTETTARILRPNYRFLTVPVLVRYRLGRATDWTASPTAPRWWADVAVGAQLQFFLGGTQATTLDGRTFRTERIGPNGGPFRPLSVALTGQVAFNYALSPRLSASVAPTMRWQVESVYKASTNLTQRPVATGVQLGVRYAF